MSLQRRPRIPLLASSPQLTAQLGRHPRRRSPLSSAKALRKSQLQIRPSTRAPRSKQQHQMHDLRKIRLVSGLESAMPDLWGTRLRYLH